MRPTRTSLAAVGYSPPIPLDWYQTPPGISLAVSISNGGSLTYSVLYYVDDLGSAAWRQVTGISRATTVITVTGDYGLLAQDGGTHGLSVGDLVQIVSDPVLAGSYNVASVVSATSYTLTSPSSGTYTAVPGVQVVSARQYVHPTLTGLTARAYGNLNLPVTAVQLYVSAYTGGVCTLSVLQGESK
jgi:hypothetical protein